MVGLKNSTVTVETTVPEQLKSTCNYAISLKNKKEGLEGLKPCGLVNINFHNAANVVHASDSVTADRDTVTALTTTPILKDRDIFYLEFEPSIGIESEFYFGVSAIQSATRSYTNDDLENDSFLFYKMPKFQQELADMRVSMLKKIETPKNCSTFLENDTDLELPDEEYEFRLEYCNHSQDDFKYVDVSYLKEIVRYLNYGYGFWADNTRLEPDDILYPGNNCNPLENICKCAKCQNTNDVFCTDDPPSIRTKLCLELIKNLLKDKTSEQIDNLDNDIYSRLLEIFPVYKDYVGSVNNQIENISIFDDYKALQVLNQFKVPLNEKYRSNSKQNHDNEDNEYCYCVNYSSKKLPNVKTYSIDYRENLFTTKFEQKFHADNPCFYFEPKSGICGNNEGYSSMKYPINAQLKRVGILVDLYTKKIHFTVNGELLNVNRSLFNLTEMENVDLFPFVTFSQGTIKCHFGNDTLENHGFMFDIKQYVNKTDMKKDLEP